MSENVSSGQLELWKEEAAPAAAQDDLFSSETLEALSRNDRRPRSTTTPAKTNRLLDQSFALRRPLNILVADDNEINRKVIRAILQKLGYNCVEAQNGKQALSRYAQEQFDYIFMDVDMPGMNGIAATEAIREIEQKDAQAKEAPAKAEIIAVTANVSEETRRLCRQAGMNGYLEKPISASIIKEQLLRSWARIRSRR